MRVFLIRHPEPAGAAGLCYGRTDLPVEPEAIRTTAEDLRRMLPEGLDAVVSSPLRRCTALAEALTESAAPTWTCDQRLVELDFGRWESLRWEEIDRAAFDHWAEDHAHRRVPGGESWQDVRRRCGAFLDDLRGSSWAAIAVLTHAGVIRAMLSLVLDIPLEPTWRLRLPFGSVVEIDLGTESANDRLVALSPGGPSTPPPRR